jgi:thiamine-phosphate pyrophosphorylase
VRFLPPSLPPFILISDAARVGEDRFLAVLEAAMAGGLEAVLVREPAWDEKRLRGLLRRVLDLGRPLRVLLSVRAASFGRLALVRELGLGGVHVGGGRTEDVSVARTAIGFASDAALGSAPLHGSTPPGSPPEPALGAPGAGPRSPARSGLLVGYSSHSLAEIREAARSGADYVFLSPIFRPLSKAGSPGSPPSMRSPPPGARSASLLGPEPLVGLEGLAEACRRSPIPVYALGGIGPRHAGALRRAGAAGGAAIGSILDASDPEEAVRSFLQGWQG